MRTQHSTMVKGSTKKRIRPTPVRASARLAKRRIRPTLIRPNAPGEAQVLLAINREVERRAREMRGSGCYPVKAHQRCTPARGSKSKASKPKGKAPAKKKAPPKKKKSAKTSASELKAFEEQILQNMAKTGRKRGEALGSKFLDDLEKRYAEIEGVKLPSKSSAPSPAPAPASRGPVTNLQSLVRKKKKS